MACTGTRKHVAEILAPTAVVDRHALLHIEVSAGRRFLGLGSSADRAFMIIIFFVFMLRRFNLVSPVMMNDFFSMSVRVSRRLLDFRFIHNFLFIVFIDLVVDSLVDDLQDFDELARLAWVIEALIDKRFRALLDVISRSVKHPVILVGKLVVVHVNVGGLEIGENTEELLRWGN